MLAVTKPTSPSEMMSNAQWPNCEGAYMGHSREVRVHHHEASVTLEDDVEGAVTKLRRRIQ